MRTIDIVCNTVLLMIEVHLRVSLDFRNTQSLCCVFAKHTYGGRVGGRNNEQGVEVGRAGSMK